jgi:hypothetical protein
VEARLLARVCFFVNVVDILLTDSYVNSWIFDTGSVGNICNTMQGIIRSRGVKEDKLIFSSGIMQ